jgi:DNA-binding MarR family transcriptional regulator
MVRTKRPWSLLSSHGLVLVTVARFGSVTVPEIADKTGLSRSTVLHSLKDLRAAGMLLVRRKGRRNEYEINAAAPFRHPLMSDLEIRGLLESVGRPAQL